MDNPPAHDLPLLAAIAEGEDVGDADFAGRAEATLHLAGKDYERAVARLCAAGLIECGSGGEVIGLTVAGRSRLRGR